MRNITDTIPADSQAMERVRLSAWARKQGISRITAYRMLKKGILPVPIERSPTGRWYVLLPVRKPGKTVIYSRADPQTPSIEGINRQVAVLAEWAGASQKIIYEVIREVANSQTGPMPKLEKLLADKQISEILIEHPSVIGIHQYKLLIAALAPQGRRITAVKP